MWGAYLNVLGPDFIQGDFVPMNKFFNQDD